MLVVLSSLRRRVWFLALLVAIFGAACSSDGAGGSAGEGSASAGTGGGTVAAGGDDGGMLPIGRAWEATVIGRFEGQGDVIAVKATREHLWVIGQQFNIPMLWRSDDGATWTEVRLVSPNADRLTMTDILDRPGGGFIGYGQRATECSEYEAPGDYRLLDRCQISRPVIYLSDDGASWRVVDPPALAPPDGTSSLFLEGLVAHGDELVATATVRGEDWHARIWTSADGEVWTLGRELREPFGGAEPFSANQLISDGETLVLLGSAHPCTAPRNASQGTWDLGVTWPRHIRILAGDGPGSLALQEPGQHPLAEAPVEVDCASISIVEFSSVPYGRADAALVGGAITLVQRLAQTDQEDAESFERIVTQLIDGAWTTSTLEMPRFGAKSIVDLDGEVAFVARTGRATGFYEFTTQVGDNSGGWTEDLRSYFVMATSVGTVAGYDGALVAAGILTDEPFDDERSQLEPGEYVVWRSVPVEAADWHACTPAPSADCAFVQLELAAGGNDFAGLDLSDIDLTLADLDLLDFDGASLPGARLVGATATGASFVGADLSGADLRASNLSDLAGADLTDADLRYARIGLSSAPAALEGALIEGTTIWMARVDLENYGQLELSLAGMDLTNTRLSGRSGGEPRIVVTDLRGAVIDNTTFAAVDLSNAEVAGVDLSGLRIDEDSICPDGTTPVVEFQFGTCE